VGAIQFFGVHIDQCTELHDDELHSEGYVMKILQSPDKHSGFEEFAFTCLSDWGSSTANVSHILEKEIMKKSYSLKLHSNLPPPPSYVKNIIKVAKRKIHGSINSKDEMSKLIQYLQENGLRHSILQDEVGCVAAISFYDPVIAPTPHAACAVYTSDVTFGITDSASGINKWSFFSRLTADI
jgi:hypothetical protein